MAHPLITRSSGALTVACYLQGFGLADVSLVRLWHLSFYKLARTITLI